MSDEQDYTATQEAKDIPMVEAELVSEPEPLQGPSTTELAQAIVGLGYQLSLIAGRVQMMEDYLRGAEEEVPGE